ncbi:MAG: calcineurin-like phosphoesterase C-terminal domain-containing protein [Fimbriimonas sp.]
MRFLPCALLFLCTLGAFAQVVPPAPDNGTARGVVFEDKNGNGRRDNGESGVPGVRVSNQRDVVATDRDGVWQLPTNDNTIFFVVKPRGWMTGLDKDNVPRFYYVHKPKGSRALKYDGVAPTGPLPASIDFPLTRVKESDRFSALFFGDTQPRDLREVDYVSRAVVEPLVGHSSERSFGIVLGDVAFDDLDVLEPLAKSIGLIGVPWYYVPGNHDINYDAENDSESSERWAKQFGPNYYSFDYGSTHFVVLDDIVWTSAKNSANNRGGYSAGLGPTQMAWLRRDLSFVPKHQRVVLTMHIPMTEMTDRQELYRLLEERPYALSVAAHTHMLEHRFIDAKAGWRGKEPHHLIINGAVCGSWWTGAPDGLGIPHTTMRDGAPNGYSIFGFDRNRFTMQYRVVNRPATYQMNIIVPEEMKLADASGSSVYVNVFNGSAKSKVEMRVGGGGWVPLTQVFEKDPFFVSLSERDKEVKLPYRPLAGADISTHLWKGSLPNVRYTGTFDIEVRTTDMFGNSYSATRGLRVVR